MITFRNLRHRICRTVAALLAATPLVLAAQQMSVVDSPHNLSARGSGPVRAASEEQVCIFCHTAHHSSGVRPLWNRQMPATGGYIPYQSNSLKAAPGQPTGTSKLCLSCHDGTIALGNVISRQQEIAMQGGVSRMRAGPTNLGTNLSDDHPISFPYDLNLVQKNGKLKSPATLATGGKA